MRTTLLTTAALLAATLAAPAHAADWRLRADNPDTCAPTVLQWMQTVGKNRLTLPALHNDQVLIGEIKWADGTVENVMVAPRGDAVCVLAVEAKVAGE